MRQLQLGKETVRFAHHSSFPLFHHSVIPFFQSSPVKASPAQSNQIQPPLPPFGKETVMFLANFDYFSILPFFDHSGFSFPLDTRRTRLLNARVLQQQTLNRTASYSGI